ncbi:unnamed protein product [Heligmosomoides polygyrus]|uniref:Secreted protein n=1 Tax=Heligmosomoides polygyrus TaxID=6339 RepID=A0A183GDF7_HELPZ|nr:unnamed protein product [Heligmosomoides polygyrus]
MLIEMDRLIFLNVILKKSIISVDIDWSTSDSCSATSITPGLKFVPPTCSARLRLAMHGRRRVRHVDASPCTVADVFGYSVPPFQL